MGRVIAVANQKGGVGKTTTAINLSACLAEKGQKVLAIDMDPQGNMTSGLGIDKDEVEKNIYDLMIGQVGVEEVLQKEAIENLDIIPTSIDLSAAEIELIGVENKEYILKRTDEIKNLQKEMAELHEILKNEDLVDNIIIGDLQEVSKKYGVPRKTDVIYHEEIKKITKEDLIENYGIKLFLTKENYFKKITLVSLRSASEQKLKENDEIIQEIETTNKTEILFFSDKQCLYKVKAHELAECKASSLGEYLNNILPMEQDEKIVYMLEPNGYKGYMLFAYENGKIAKIEMSAYETKTFRRKLVNAYSNKAPLAKMLYISEDTDVVLIRDIDKAMLVNSELVPQKQTKSSGGVQIYTLKKNSKVTNMMYMTDFKSENIEYYRSTKIPATGHFINEQDKIDNDIPRQIGLFE